MSEQAWPYPLSPTESEREQEAEAEGAKRLRRCYASTWPRARRVLHVPIPLQPKSCEARGANLRVLVTPEVYGAASCSRKRASSKLRTK
eukprot:5671713-Pleurochrysis_carterae.AAC.3